MLVKRWTTVNIEFDESERKSAERLVRRYLKRGYDDNGEDDGVTHEVNRQLISQTKVVADTDADEVKR